MVSIDQAIQRTIKEFPFEGYMTKNETAKHVYRDIASTVLRYLQPGSSILDFGCGPCDKTAVLQYLGFHCSAYDDLQDGWHKVPGNREKMLSFTKKCGIDFVEAGDAMLPFQKQSYDMVMLHHVLEHLHNSPRDLIKDLLDLVKPEGLIFITVPNAVNIRKRIDVLRGSTNLPQFEGYYWNPGSWRGHIREYVRDDLVKLSEYLGLDVLHIRGCDHMIEKVPAIGRPAYLLATRIFQGWKDSWSLVARKRPGWHVDKILPPRDLAGILGNATFYE